MPANTYWDDPDHTIYIIEALPPSTWDEAHEAFAQAYEAIEGVGHDVVIILDARRDPNPPSPAVLTEFRNLLGYAPANLAGLILIGANYMATGMIAALGRVFGKVKLAAVRDRAEADEHISTLL
jgi:hypothetical protein